MRTDEEVEVIKGERIAAWEKLLPKIKKDVEKYLRKGWDVRGVILSQDRFLQFVLTVPENAAFPFLIDADLPTRFWIINHVFVRPATKAEYEILAVVSK